MLLLFGVVLLFIVSHSAFAAAPAASASCPITDVVHAFLKRHASLSLYKQLNDALEIDTECRPRGVVGNFCLGEGKKCCDAEFETDALTFASQRDCLTALLIRASVVRHVVGTPDAVTVRTQRILDKASGSFPKDLGRVYEEASALLKDMEEGGLQVVYAVESPKFRRGLTAARQFATDIICSSCAEQSQLAVAEATGALIYKISASALHSVTKKVEPGLSVLREAAQNVLNAALEDGGWIDRAIDLRLQHFLYLIKSVAAQLDKSTEDVISEVLQELKMASTTYDTIVKTGGRMLLARERSFAPRRPPEHATGRGPRRFAFIDADRASDEASTTLPPATQSDYRASVKERIAKCGEALQLVGEESKKFSNLVEDALTDLSLTRFLSLFAAGPQLCVYDTLVNLWSLLPDPRLDAVFANLEVADDGTVLRTDVHATSTGGLSQAVTGLLKALATEVTQGRQSQLDKASLPLKRLGTQAATTPPAAKDVPKSLTGAIAGGGASSTMLQTGVDQSDAVAFLEEVLRYDQRKRTSHSGTSRIQGTQPRSSAGWPTGVTTTSSFLQNGDAGREVVVVFSEGSPDPTDKSQHVAASDTLGALEAAAVPGAASNRPMPAVFLCMALSFILGVELGGIA